MARSQRPTESLLRARCSRSLAELSLAHTHPGHRGVEPEREQEIGVHSRPRCRQLGYSGAAGRPAPVGTWARRPPAPVRRPAHSPPGPAAPAP